MISEKVDELARQCRKAGKRLNYARVLDLATDAILLITSDRDKNFANTKVTLRRQSQLATILGYKGFALMKLERYQDALTTLEESQKLHEQTQQHRQDDQEPTSLLSQRESAAVQQSLKQLYQRLGRSPALPTLIKYPRTTHLFDSGGTATTVDDLVLPDLSLVISMISSSQGMPVVIEEKIDGANLGISMCPYTGMVLVQNRSHYISKGEHSQFNRIPSWIEEHRQALTELLQGGDLILYGEWVAARHSVPYQQLPGWFVAFDLYSKSDRKFYSRPRFHSCLKGSGIPAVPVIEVTTSLLDENQAGHTTSSAKQCLRKKLVSLISTPSAFRSDGGTVEGIVLRIDEDVGSPDSTEPSMWLREKFKVVRPDFVRGCGAGHWAKRQIEKQVVDFQFAESYLKQCYPFS